MATALHNLSTVTSSKLPSAAEMVVGIVVSEWNSDVTDKLLYGAIERLRSAGCPAQNILVRHVPGAFELPLGAQFFAQNSSVDGIIALGCVIRGDTPHFEYVCSGTTQGIVNVQLSWNIPVAFGLLTVENEQQALDRAGGKLGNKGEEAATTIIRMIALHNDMTQYEESAESEQNSDFMDMIAGANSLQLS